MEQTVMVFVGCGGTFWTASPMLAALVRKYNPAMCHFIDPDRVEEQNLERQWVLARPGEPKATLGGSAIGPSGPSKCVERFFWEVRDDLQAHGEAPTMVFVVNVDNDEARLEVRAFCREYPGTAIMVMSGCDQNFGQVYTGWWDNWRTVHDWLESHPDIREGKPPGDTCGQNIFSNAMTGVFLGAALHHVMDALRNGEPPEEMLEWYWRRGERDHKIKSWTEAVRRTG